MKLLLLVLTVPGLASAATSIFDFNNLKGFEKCMQQTHLIESVKDEDVSQGRSLDRFEIQSRCLQTAAKVLARKKDKAEMMNFIKATKRNTAHENAIDLVQLLVETSLPSCNDMDAYMVVKKALSGPRYEGEEAYFERAKKVVKTCLKDSEFKKDFMEELEASDPYLRTNVCAILLEEKLAKGCKKDV